MNEFGHVAYLALLALLAPFGAHRLRLVWLRLRRPPRAEAHAWRGPLPVVTVQLPVFNEANVVERLIDAACRLDYPVERLEIQVLDDSDDETVALAAARVLRWRARGIDIRHVRRPSRRGFKAGALEHGASIARGDFLAVLDADFVAPPALIRDLLPPFADPSVGAVQAAWDHLSPDATWLTRAQALLLDAHFAIEHEARYRAGLFFNFNGSAGMWRKDCIEAAGGWQSDTLTEDVDLSYRAQLAGWRFVYRDDVRVPAELPSSLRAVEIQQGRWTQGGIQCARKLLPRIWDSPLPTAHKLEAAAHLAGHAVHPLTLTMAVALAAAGWLARTDFALPAFVHATALLLATVPFVLFYGLAGAMRRRRRLARRIVEALLLGLGLGVPLTFAVLRGLSGRRTPFARTPKRGFAATVAYRARLSGGPTILRLGLAIALCGAIVNAALFGSPAVLPFTALFAMGYALASRECLRATPAPAIPG